MKILVVDDEFVSRERVAKILSNLGHQTHVATNGVEALEALKTVTFDLIFSDILMPVMDGFRLCQECKSDPDLNTIPFVVHTATYTDQKDEELALKFGADRFLCKPAKRELIRETVEALMRDDHGPKAPSLTKDLETEKDLFKLYNERLIDKLEKKMLDLQREVSERKRIELALEKAKSSLETMIDERTDELVQANRQLKKEIFERRQAEEKLKKSEKKYRDLSITDPLTTLHNLRHFHTQLSQEIKRANRYDRPLSLLLLDVDSFKKYNDTHGHLEGDHVLVKLGQVIHKCMRATDSAFRYGGEEFTVILPETQAKEAFVVAERIRTHFKAAEFFPVAEKKSHLTISVGVSQYVPSEQATSFIDRTDKAMYQAKNEGKDKVFIAFT